ncbi:MAG TPA: adenylosuccinate synthase [bacterium]
MNTAIVGLQWGDEGKGKVVDHLARDCDIDVRFQGGSNAGHTVWLSGQKIVFHQIPCGILHKNVVGVIGAGCVLDPEVFFEELSGIKKQVPDAEKFIKISRFCHLIMPYHILIDKIKEESKQGIGTTKKGIGIAYEDKYARIGLRVGDLFNGESFKTKLRANISRKNLMLMEIFHAEPLSDEEIYDKYSNYAEQLRPMIVDDSKYLTDAINSKKRIIFEGAQGALLDVDFGTYPYVTSSHTISGGASIGLGIPPYAIERVIGVAKAYTTRVGQGPFPTEDTGASGKALRDSGNEYGSTTGRPRRCGAFDASVVKYAARLTGARELFLTKLDVLSGLKTIKIAVGYANATEFDPFIADKLEPVYEEVPGFNMDLTNVRNFNDFPEEVKDYIKLIEHYTGLKITRVSVGADREAVVVRQ